MKLSTATLLLACASTTNAHGTITQPKVPKITMDLGSWRYMWFNQGSEIGCPVATGQNCGSGSPSSEGNTPCCEEQFEPTLKDVEQLTYMSDKWWSAVQTADSSSTQSMLRGAAKVSPKDFASVTNTPLKRNPWLAPGHAPVVNSCGILGGWQYNSAQDYIAGPGDGYENLMNGTGGAVNSYMPPANLTIPAGTHGNVVLLEEINHRMQEAQGEQYTTNDNPRWKAGSVQNVSYSLSANHGGGFQWRVCPIEFLLNDTLDEGCFTALDFVGDESWFVYKNDSDNETQTIPFTPVRVSDANTNGVLPKGSTWTQIGLPACGDFATPDWNCDGPMFENEISKAGFWGGPEITSNISTSPALFDIMEPLSARTDVHPIPFEIVDTIQVPKGMEGDYVLSWRWDSEQSSQVWTQCTIVTIEA